MIEHDIMLALNSLVADQVYYDNAPQGTPLPYITLQQVGGSPVQYLDNATLQDKVRIQVDVFAADRAAANGIMTSVRNVLAAEPFLAAAIGSPVSGYEPTVQTFRRSCDFTLMADV